MTASTPPDFKVLTERAQATWATGDFNEIGRGIIPVSEALCQTMDPRPGQRVLDVACGAGNATIPAARAGGIVTGVDITPELLDAGRAVAPDIEWVEGDAEALPF